METKMTMATKNHDVTISAEAVKSIIEADTPRELFENKRVLVLTPDTTRTCPLPMMVQSVRETIGCRASKLDFMVALGTHQTLSEENILKLYGLSREDQREKYADSRFLNHRWDLPETLIQVGQITRDEVEAVSGGRLSETVSIDINKAVFDYDLVLILGPVFPHEVVGFSGGAKYLFPGISGGEFLHFFHWLAAIITCRNIIGCKDTPVRQMIDKAMEKIETPVHCAAMVVNHTGGLSGFYVGDYRSAWSQAADLSAKMHIVTKKAPYQTVLGRCPHRYDEIWTAGKVMYKLEQAVTQGGDLIIYAPHIKEISTTWGEYIERIGYHVRDYFLTDMDRFKDIPRGVLAHSTHVRGSGTFENGLEKPDVNVILATGIPREKCERVNLGYMNPDDIDLSRYRDKEDQGILFVDNAGETLYRLGIDTYSHQT
ncbi:MAG: lactate racemase domain-containing protein [Desulfobacteraceae bacterium]|jgi:nickel-dependent lactate racemase|nr:lactate racemase domain-containing protein [Desulfobacteraceae bacterium]